MRCGRNDSPSATIRKKSLPGQEAFRVKRDSIHAGRAKTFDDGLVEHFDSKGCDRRALVRGTFTKRRSGRGGLRDESGNAPPRRGTCHDEGEGGESGARLPTPPRPRRRPEDNTARTSRHRIASPFDGLRPPRGALPPECVWLRNAEKEPCRKPAGLLVFRTHPGPMQCPQTDRPTPRSEGRTSPRDFDSIDPKPSLTPPDAG